MKIKIVTKKKDHEQKLLKLVPYQIGMMKALSEEYKFKNPQEVVLRPMKVVNRPTESHCLAWAGYNLTTGYYVSMIMSLFNAGLRYELDVLSHEMAHIAVCQKLKRWGHPPLHEEMYKFAHVWVKKRVR
ncbi:MAG: hypothetical protein C4581_13590 [Nitrospiraceae bacterium]|nr:MAG: hypothetical protein C4581_13590 [Nitrospiraceae bacterium]